MGITRRGFLALGGGLIATATMAEASAIAEYMDWMKRKPVFSFAPYRPNDGPEVFVVTRVVNGIPVAFNGPYLPVDMTEQRPIIWTESPSWMTERELTGNLIRDRAAIHTTHVGQRKRPLPGFVRTGDIVDYYDMRTMPPPSETAERNSEIARRSILNAYEAEQSGDKAKVADSMNWQRGILNTGHPLDRFLEKV